MKTVAFALLALVLPLSAFAVSIPSLTGVEVVANPEHPRPGQSVTLTANPIGVRVQDAVFQWTVDGKVVVQQAGAQSITLTVPAAGKSSAVSINVYVGGQPAGDATFTLRGSTLALVWEGTTARVPFYIGRPEVNGHGSVIATAIPNLIDTRGTALDTNTVTFEWSIDGKPQQKLSGIGRSTAQLSVPFYNSPFRLSVVATSPDGTLSAEESTVIQPKSPDMVMYQETPLGGLETERAIVGQINFIDQEMTVRAYPMTVTDPASLAVTWTLDNTPFTIDPDSPWTAVFRKTAEGSGSYTVGLSFTHIKNFLEAASQSFKLTF